MISLYDILEAADGQLFGEPAAEIFSDFSYDSRRVSPGDLFVALKTERGDGHHFMQDAVNRGATGIMCTHPPSFETDGLTVIVMRSVERALMRWTEIILQKYGTTVIAVTGSAGKSVTKEAIAQVLRQRFEVYTSADSFNGRFGLPLTLGKLAKEHRIAVLEFGINQFGEMAEMVAVTKPMVGVVTAIQHAHIDRLGSLEQIAQEKGALIRELPPEGLAVLNFDDPLVRAMAPLTQAPVMTVGLDISEPAFGADLLAFNLVVDRYKTGFDLRHGGERFPGRWVPLLGAHQLYSALAALAVGLSYDIALEDGLHALTELALLPGRMNPLDGPNGSLLVDDSYSANPDTMLAVLDWLNTVRDERGRAVFVMGDMDELGGYTSLAHIQVGQRAADIADQLVTQGDLAAEAGRVALEHGMERSKVTITFSTEDAARAAGAQLGPHDIVVVKGGVRAGMERVVRRLVSSDTDVMQLVRRTGVHEQIEAERSDRPTWVHIDMEAIAYNTRRMKEIVGPEVALLAMVRANAYGHGAIPVSTTVLNNGAEVLGVSSLAEALELREAGVDAPILILGYTPGWAALRVIRYNLTVTLYDADMARTFDRAAREVGATISAHVLVDTGLGMLGLLPEEVTLFFRSLHTLNRVQIEGIYTQFSVSAENLDYTRAQLSVFESVVDPLLAAGFGFKYIHAADSAAAIHLPGSRFSMVRAGLALYGVNPGMSTPIPADFKPALVWKTTVAQIKRLPPGSFVGDGNTYRTPSTRQIALIPVGYADGFRRAPTRWKHVLVRGAYAPVLGQVGMDLTAIDITDIEGVQMGEEVVLIGTQGRRSLTITDAAEHLGTNTYEVISTVLARVPRVK
jgi:alanine racemase